MTLTQVFFNIFLSASGGVGGAGERGMGWAWFEWGAKVGVVGHLN